MNPQNLQPETIPQQTQPETKFKNWYKYGFWGLIVILFLIGYLLLRLLASDLLKKSNDVDVPRPNANTSQTTQITQSQSISSTITLPDFSKKSVKPKTQIDTSAWKTFDDPQVGLRFKYPPEWGEPNLSFFDASKTTYTEDEGFGFDISFQNDNKKKLNLSGNSQNWSCGACDDWDGIIGFNQDNWQKFSQICSDNNNLVTCLNNNSIIKLLKQPKCDQWQSSEYEMVLYLYRPEKSIMYINFNYSFFSDEYNDFFNGKCNGKGGSYLSQKSQNELFSAINNRRLDSESVKNYDTIEKVFETVESY